ncbi:MAG: hypothetical protein M0D53_11970 [Flavobacterium sp. JAD_PAG50586_2]|nr:MAG: hypothetical protein M0D53_11970 [Flavobacterium sp. JAD_PAG50586_2]
MNFGLGIQTGAVFKVSESTSFGIMIDIQGDLNKISKDDLKVKQSNTSLISLNFNHRI